LTRPWSCLVATGATAALRTENDVTLKVLHEVHNLVAAAFGAENDILLLEAVAHTEVTAPLPPAVLVDAVSATVERSGVLVFTVLTALTVDRNDLLDLARPHVLVDTDVEAAMYNMVHNDVDTSTTVLTAVAEDSAPLLNTCDNGVQEVALVILEVMNDVNTSVVTVLVNQNDVLLLEATADADVKMLVPPEMIVGAVSATVEGSGVPILTAIAVLDIDGDEVLDSARAQALVRTGVDVAIHQVGLDDVDDNTLVLKAVADDDVLLLNTRVNVVGVAALVTLQVVDDINTPVATELGAEDDVLLLETATDADVTQLIFPAMFANAVSATKEGSSVIVFLAPAVLDVDRDRRIDSARARVMVGRDEIGSAVLVTIKRADDVNTPVVTARVEDCFRLLWTYYCFRLLCMHMWKCSCLLQCLWVPFRPPIRAQVS